MNFSASQATRMPMANRANVRTERRLPLAAETTWRPLNAPLVDAAALVIR
jgi:hypothetical protein